MSSGLTRNAVTGYVIATVGVWIIAPGAVASDEIDLRTGAWEVVTTTQMTGAPLSREELSRLTPAERAQVEAALREEAARGPQSEVSRECITSRDLQRPFAPPDAENCTSSLVRTSRTSYEGHMNCTGGRKGKAVLKVQAPTPEFMSAAFELRSGEEAGGFMLRLQMKGRWLSAQCDDEDAPEEDEEDLSAPDEYDEPEDEG